MSSNDNAPRLALVETRCFERDVTLRMPFRFGVVTLTHAPQIFVRACVRLEDGRTGWGTAAEMLAPKWFDKNPELSNEDNFQQLRDAVALASRHYRDTVALHTPFGLHAENYNRQIVEGGHYGLNPLVAGFGNALLDRAIIDALGRLLERPVFELVRGNALGIDARLTPELASFDLDAFLASLGPAPAIGARHTVGLVDAITEGDIADDARVNDGLPESLEACVRHYGLRYFKLKVGGDLDADIDRLEAIAAVLDRDAGDYRATLDGNEQYENADAVLELLERMKASPKLARLRRSILFLEQPIKRQMAFATAIESLAAHLPVEIDESDSTLDAFVEAKRLGYRGVSSKSCKGFYKSLLNRARCALWNREEGEGVFFMSAEDLTTQAGMAVQQDLALATLIGCNHVERNGHHYVDGMKGLPEAEQAAFLAAHPDLYHRAGGNGHARLTIKEGRIALGSLSTPGLACAVEPDFKAMRQLP